MPTRKNSQLTSHALKLGELGLAAPQVIAHRLSRMALAGASPSARDQKEFTQMIQEKQLAFSQSWMNMCGEIWRIQQAMFAAWFKSLTPMNMLQPMSSAQQRRQARIFQNGLHTIASKGLAPIHQKAVANSKRLAKTSLR